MKQIDQKIEAALALSDAKTEKSLEKILEEKIVKKVVNVRKLNRTEGSESQYLENLQDSRDSRRSGKQQR